MLIVVIQILSAIAIMRFRTATTIEWFLHPKIRVVHWESTSLQKFEIYTADNLNDVWNQADVHWKDDLRSHLPSRIADQESDLHLVVLVMFTNSPWHLQKVA